MSSSRSSLPTARYRPVAVPDDVDAPGAVKASGRVVLPFHVRWSGDRVYDLDNEADRKSAYKQVLSHGLAEDVRRFIRVRELAALWDQMVLPSYVRDAWGPWLRQRGLLQRQGMLSPLPRRLRRIIDTIPEAGNVALAGGRALIVQVYQFAG